MCRSDDVYKLCGHSCGEAVNMAVVQILMIIAKYFI
jgi:hypothetical protein